jgi:hypothetical protein
VIFLATGGEGGEPEELAQKQQNFMGGNSGGTMSAIEKVPPSNPITTKEQRK